MNSAIVTTTIFLPTFLTKYAENLKDSGWKTSIIVVGDEKSPKETAQFCATIPNCIYLDVVDQELYLMDHGHTELMHHLPKNSISRRNIGHLYAYEEGADFIVMLDDDNLATNYDVMGHHSIVGRHLIRPTYSSTSGWFNVCQALKEEHGVEFYARGYPPAQRWNDGLVTVETARRKVAVNAGLWINDPDIDAITRLERHLKTTGIKESYPNSFALQPGTWSPWNCQNTAISRAALPSYFLSPHIGRHLDIWASYITTRIAEAMNEVITFGLPLANHERTPHNLYRDLSEETPWIAQTDDFVDVLRSIKVTSKTYLGGLQEVIDGLNSSSFRNGYTDGLQIWHDIFARLGA